MSIAQGLNKRIETSVSEGKIKEALDLMNTVKNNPTAYIDVCKVFVSACVKNGKIKEALNLMNTVQNNPTAYAELSDTFVQSCIENQVDITEIADALASSDEEYDMILNLDRIEYQEYDKLCQSLFRKHPIALRLIANSYKDGLPFYLSCKDRPIMSELIKAGLDKKILQPEDNLFVLNYSSGMPDAMRSETPIDENDFKATFEAMINCRSKNKHQVWFNYYGLCYNKYVLDPDDGQYEADLEKLKNKKDECSQLLSDVLDENKKFYKPKNLPSLPFFYQMLYKIAFDEKGNRREGVDVDSLEKFIELNEANDYVVGFLPYDRLPIKLKSNVEFILNSIETYKNEAWFTGLVQEVVKSKDPDKINRIRDWLQEKGRTIREITDHANNGPKKLSDKVLNEFISLIENNETKNTSEGNDSPSNKETDGKKVGSKKVVHNVEINCLSEYLLMTLMEPTKIPKPKKGVIRFRVVREIYEFEGFGEDVNEKEFYKAVLKDIDTADLCAVNKGGKTILHCLIDLKDPELIKTYFERVKSFKGDNKTDAWVALNKSGKDVLDYLQTCIENEKNPDAKKELMTIFVMLKTEFWENQDSNVNDPQKSASSFEHLNGVSMAEFLSVDNYAQKFGDLEENYLHQAARTNRADVINIYGKFYSHLFEETNKLGQKPLEIAIVNNQNLITIAALAKYTKMSSMHQIVSKHSAELTGDVKTYLDFLIKFDENGVFTGTQEEFDAIAKNKKFIPYLTDWLTTRFEGKKIEDVTVKPVQVAQPKQTAQQKGTEKPSGKAKGKKRPNKAKKNRQANLGQHLGQASEGQVALADNTDGQKTSRVAPFNKLGERLS